MSGPVFRSLAGFALSGVGGAGVVAPVSPLGRALRRTLDHKTPRVLAGQAADDAAGDGSKSFHDGKVQSPPSVRKLKRTGGKQ